VSAGATSSAHRGRRGAVVAWSLAAAVGVVLSGCGGSGSAALPLASPAAAPTSRLVATVLGSSVDVYTAPGAPQAETALPNPWLLNGDPSLPIPQVFLVVGRPDAQWVEVLLPERPNGSLGWVHGQAVALQDDPYSLDVAIGAHLLTVHDGGRVIYSGPVATGAPDTPTPTGEFYIRVLLRSTDPTSVYGPFAYGLSAHSDALTTFDGGDAEIGVHGNNDASVLGQSITHGCVRMDNDEITALSSVLPLGTPVYLRA